MTGPKPHHRSATGVARAQALATYGLALAVGALLSSRASVSAPWVRALAVGGLVSALTGEVVGLQRRRAVGLAGTRLVGVVSIMAWPGLFVAWPLVLSGVVVWATALLDLRPTSADVRR